MLCGNVLTGPGAYDVPAGDRGPKFSMGARGSSQDGAGETPGWLLREGRERGRNPAYMCTRLSASDCDKAVEGHGV